MNGLLLGGALAAFVYALTRRASTTSAPAAQHAPAPDLPTSSPTSPAPTSSTLGAPVLVMAGFNVGWPENMVATLGYMEANVPPAVEQVVAELNRTGHGTFSSPRTMIRSTSYGYLATVLVRWQTTGARDTAWLASAVRSIIRARGGQVASHLRDVTATL